MRSILVPIDGSRHARNALKLAISMVQKGLLECSNSPQIHIINVQPIIVPLSDFYDYDIIEKAQHDEAEKTLKPACRLLEKAGVAYAKACKVGPTATTIVDYAKTHKCDWIIMGTRGMSAFGGLIMGSTSNQVVHLAKIPVTLVK
jgi:nucleotide-binding universal stress UspA family protein